jgi:dolichol-phosphate mannosyltransferase
MKKVAIILPTYNESKNIESLISQIFTVTKNLANWDIHLMIVDSDSPDGTADIVDTLQKKNKHIHLIRTKKEGLGKAYIEGFTYAIEELNPFVLFEMDADLSHNPNDIPRFLNEIAKGADFVIGSRYRKGGSIPKDWGLDRKFLSIVGNWILRVGFMNLKITDWTSGYRAIKTWIIKESLHKVKNYTGYVFQVAILDSALKSRANVHEVPIHFVDRVEGYSKINSRQYTFHTLFYMFSNSSFIKYVITGGIGFILDFGISYVFIEELHTAIWFSTIISAEAAIISNFLFNNYWSFSHKQLSGKQNIIWNFVKFNFIASISLLIQALGMEGSVYLFGREYWYIYKIIIIIFIIIPYSYILYNKIIWKNK